MQTEPQISQTERFARCIVISKRVRWDIEKDVIRGRSFDVAYKFLPDRLSRVDQIDFLSPGRVAMSESNPGPHLRQRVQPGRTLYQCKGAGT
jgi:hypothetical protein